MVAQRPGVKAGNTYQARRWSETKDARKSGRENILETKNYAT